MAILSKDTVRTLIKEWIEPLQNRDPISARQLKRIHVEGNHVKVSLTLGLPGDDHAARCADQLRTFLGERLPGARVNVTVDWRVRTHAVQDGLQPLPGVRNLIAVASGKGGVGKSTTAVNLALALRADGARVGMLDADLYGPSQPRMLGVSGRPHSADGEHMEPLEGHGVKVMSVGFMVEEEAPVIWRGSMVSRALEKLVLNTRWGELDYLILDLPPGTGDIQLTLAQRIPVSGALIVTTPQDIALLDARKGLRMFAKTGVPVLGLVENMSMHVCSRCGHAEALFGDGGGERLAAEQEVPLLGRLPLDLAIRECADGGTPTVVAAPDSPAAGLYRTLARHTAAALASRPLDRGERFPPIAVHNA